MSREPIERTVLIPIRVRDGSVELLYGGPLPVLEDGTVGDLVVPAFAFRDAELLQQYIRELAGPILAAGTVLLASVSTATARRPEGVLDQPIDGSAVQGGVGPFVKLVLEDSLELTLRGTKRAALRDCACRIPCLPEVRARSVNHAYTIISERFEPSRRSHGGNAFLKVFYLDRSGPVRAWRPLEVLRTPREAAIEARVRNTVKRP